MTEATETKPKVKLIPKGDRVLIKPFDAEKITKGGIILPDVAQEKPKEGEIVVLGDGHTNDGTHEFKVKVGDRVIYSAYAGTQVKANDDEFLVVAEEDIIATVESV